MRCFSRWVTFFVLASCSTLAIAQSRQATDVAYNTSIPSPHESFGAIGSGVSNAIGSGVDTVSKSVSLVENAAADASHSVGESQVVIPQQGSVDMGVTYSQPVYGSPTPLQSAPTYSAPSCSTPSYSYAPAPAYSNSSCNYGGGCGGKCGQRSVSTALPGCSSCGSKSCLGSCKLGKCKLGSCKLGDCCIGKCGLGGLLGKVNPNHTCCSGWFGGLYALNLSRDDDNFGYPLASDAGGQTVLATGMARMDDSLGFGARIGKMLSKTCAFEVIYWQIFPDDVTAIAQTSVVGSPINANYLFTGLEYDPGTGAVPVDSYFQGAQYMSVTRTFDYRNFEVNFLRLPFTFSGCANSKARLAILAGARYFQAEESLEIFSDLNNEIVGDDPANELSYRNEVENHLIGLQVGGLFSYQFSSKLTGQMGSKVGIYNNRMEQSQEVYSPTGTATIAAGPDAGQPFSLRSDKDDIAFLGEFDAGLAYCLNKHWRVSGGYKILAVSSYADSTNQIPYNFNLAEAGLIQDNNSLILHGFYLGGEYAW